MLEKNSILSCHGITQEQITTLAETHM
uniref:Uncharacterized protein n=1 Tax=Rhizophora mucronata TaxID=61149 RepID=A0A2P2NXU2_RHIMU